MRRVWIILLMVLCLFCSCDADVSTDKKGNVQGNTDSAVPGTPQIEEVVYETDNVFKFREFADVNGGKINNWGIQQIGDMFWFCNWHPDYLLLRYDVYDSAGVFQYSRDLPDIVQQNASLVTTPDGERFYTNEIVDGSWMQFCCYDADGNLLAQSKKYIRLYPNGNKDIQDMQFFGDDLYYYRNYTVYRFPDGDITQDAQIMEFPCYPDFVSLAPDGSLYVSGTVTSSILDPTEHFLFDPSTGESEKHPLTQNGKTADMLFENATRFYLNGDTIYAFCEDGFYAARGGETEQIINWNESGLLPSVLGITRVLSDRFIYASYQNPLEHQMDIGLLCLTQERRNQKREVITLATIGLKVVDQYFLDAAVYLFNRDNVDYVIEYHNYYDRIYSTDGNGNTMGYRTNYDEALYEDAQRQFEEDLLAGILYDCYVFPEISPNRDLLADKGLFADLSPYLEEDQILGCVETAYVTDDGIVALPYFMRLSTLMTSQAILSPQKQLTYDVLMDIAAGLDDGETLFGSGSGVYENLKLTGQYEFIDYFNETCSFDSEESIEWMRFLMDVKNGTYSDEALQILYEQKYTTYQEHYMSSMDVPGREIKLKTAKFFEMTLGTIESVGAAQWLYSLDRINYCGYPTKDGPVLRMSCDAMFSVTADARSPGGADAFLDFLLSSDMQGCAYMQHFALPVSREGMIAAFPRYVHCCVRGIGKQISNSWFTLHPDSFYLKIICSEECMDEYNQQANGVFDVIRVSDDDRDLFIRFLDRAVVRTAADATLQSILDEELSYVESGVRSPEEAGKILQSRVGIYLAE